MSGLEPPLTEMIYVATGVRATSKAYEGIVRFAKSELLVILKGGIKRHLGI